MIRSREKDSASQNEGQEFQPKTSEWIPRRLDEDPKTSSQLYTENLGQQPARFQSSWKPTIREEEPVGDASNAFWDIGFQTSTLEEQALPRSRYRRGRMGLGLKSGGVLVQSFTRICGASGTAFRIKIR